MGEGSRGNGGAPSPRARKKGSRPLTDSSPHSKKRRLPTLPLLRSTIGVTGLNFSVRDGKRWIPRAIKRTIGHPAKGKPRSQNISYPSGQGKSRAISTTRLRRRRPYTCGLSRSSSLTALHGDLISGPASCLDAFSTYPIRTWIPGGAPGGTTGKPEVRPTRSSRTSARAPQISRAHDR